MVGEQIHEDIKWLESQLEAKKKELSGTTHEHKEEREAVRDVLREVPQISSPNPLPPSRLSDDAATIAADEIKEKEHEQIVEDLIKIVFTKNLSSALKVVERLKNPHLLDEFHDRLADKYYEKLIQSRKINL